MLFDMFRDNVLLLLDKPEGRTLSGLYTPNMKKNEKYGSKMLGATVLKVGPGGHGYKNETEDWTHFEMEVRKGERVLVHHLCGQDFTVGKDIRCSTAPDYETGDELRVVRCHEIEAVLE